jgi:hypothetical protein
MVAGLRMYECTDARTPVHARTQAHTATATLTTRHARVNMCGVHRFTWYQGEANTENATSAAQYSCMFPQMITAWRSAFEQPTAFFGFVQLSTWCALPADSLPQMRQAQMAAMTLPNVGYATNAGPSLLPSIFVFVVYSFVHAGVLGVHRAISIHEVCMGESTVSTSFINCVLIVHLLVGLIVRLIDAVTPPKKDHGMGCTIHPAEKQFVGKRLAHAALGVHYKHNTVWQSPTYKSAVHIAADPTTASSVSIAVSLNGVSETGLHTIHPYNYYSLGYGPAGAVPTVVDCTTTYPVNSTYNASMARQCAWGSLEVAGVGWVNATVAIEAAGQRIVLTAALPATLMAATAPAVVIGSSYGWGPIPMMNAYDQTTNLPVLPWNERL